MKPMHLLLMIAYYFPPMGGAGVQRSLKFAKYLPENGWQPTVLAGQPGQRIIADPSLENDLPASVAVHRAPAWLLPPRLPFRLRHAITRWLLLVDEQIGWMPFAIRRARKLLQSGNFHAIYTTSAPYTDHLIGLRLKRATGLPWVADFRDPWVGNFSEAFATPLHEKLALRLERQVTAAADRVLVVSEPMRQALLARHALAPSKVVTIPNGYDPADFSPPVSSPQSNCMTIAYSGSFYGKRQTPRYFIEALQTALRGGEIPADKLRLHLIGNLSRPIVEQIRTSGIDHIVQQTGYLPHRESLQQLLAANVLLLIIGSGRGSEAVYTGKIFEYLAARKPILALAPPGVAADLVQEARAGVVVPPEDTTAIREQIVALYQQWQRGALRINPNADVIARYDRRKLTAQLASLLNEVCQ